MSIYVSIKQHPWRSSQHYDLYLPLSMTFKKGDMLSMPSKNFGMLSMTSKKGNMFSMTSKNGDMLSITSKKGDILSKIGFGSRTLKAQIYVKMTS